LAVSCLLISYLAPFVSPENFTFIAFFGLAYPVLVVINLVFVVYWLILWKKRFLISFIAILTGWFLLINYWSFNFKNSIAPSGNNIKVMCYNVREFDLYNRPYNVTSRNKMFDLIRDESPAIICFQDFYADDIHSFNTMDTLLQIQEAKNHHVAYTNTVLENYHFGIATFSKYPIINKGEIDLPSDRKNTCIYTDLKINNDTVRVYNIHLQSVRLSNIVYADPKIRFETKEVYENDITSTYKLLSFALKTRIPQAELVTEHIRKCRYKTIVCGDLNDIPASYVYHSFSRYLVDAFKESGAGFGITFAGKIPFLRIDYIFHSTSIKSYGFNVIPEKLSDHYPVVCTLQL